MNRKHAETLKNAGLDTDRYLSLRIDRTQFPDGSEIVIKIRDQSGELRDLPIDKGTCDGFFGKSSVFYKKTMADGHIFNPYIHRRFLPAQFRRNMRVAGTLGIRDFVRKSYGWNYVVRFLCEECWKLSMLEKRDREAFNERSRFFPLNDMKRVFCDYANEVERVLNEACKKPYVNKEGKTKVVYYLPKGIGYIKHEHVRPMRYRFGKFKEAVSACRTYAQLAQHLDNFDFCKLDNAIPVSDVFVSRFLESGAFYTLKQMVMFEGLSLGGEDVMENMRRLNDYPQHRLLQLFCQHDR